jgi:hypothetical protein
MMRRTSIVLSGALLALGLAACGSDDPPETPAACLAPASAYLTALKAAPGEVLVGGETPISGCLVEEQEPGALQAVGQSLVEAATELNGEVRRGGARAQTVELGYLVGAVQEAAAGTGGIHEDLVLRLDAAARFTGAGDGAFSAEIERGFNQGYAAGQTNG